jgi:CO dehydrogenase maturation factor
VRELTAKISAANCEHVVLDMEAGVEHLSRGTTRNTDTLLVIAEPYYKSLETAARVATLGRELGIQRVLTLANKVRPADKESVSQFARRHGIQLIEEIPYDESVAEADRLGIAPIDHDETSSMVRAINALTGRLLAT